MIDLSPELKQLLIQYGNDYKALLKDHPDISYLYALSPMRENILEWYEFDPEGTVLEIGSDYGALTGLLAQKTRSVTVLDPDKGNLAVNKMRHEGLDNISYVQEKEAIEGNFDYVVMIGTLTEPADECIREAMKFLTPNGYLIGAVCNPLGLKYWAGARSEEVCLSRRETEGLFEGHGGRLEFYYPIPDYRLPLTVYSQSLLPSKGELTHALLAYDYPKYLRFDLGKKYDDVCESGVFEDFANSFLFIWSRYEEG